MNIKRKRFWIAIGIIGVFIATASVVLPVGEVFEWLTFKVAPGQFKTNNVRRFRATAGEQEIILVGTVHQDHVGSDSAYPLWELKALIEHWRPDLVLLEIKPEAARDGHWAEGPIEMPFCALVAEEAGIRVDGMDFWRKETSSGTIRNSDEREDHMGENILSKNKTAHRTLVFTGYSHLWGLAKRLERGGFRSTPLSADELRAAFEHNVTKVYPSRLKDELVEAIGRAENHQNDFDSAWAERRKEAVRLLALP